VVRSTIEAGVYVARNWKHGTGSQYRHWANDLCAYFRGPVAAIDDEQTRAVFLTLVRTGLRSAELRSLRWRDVDLIENRLRVENSKTETGERSIAFGKALAEELWEHRLGRRRVRALAPGARQPLSTSAASSRSFGLG
jgi:integrase